LRKNVISIEAIRSLIENMTTLLAEFSFDPPYVSLLFCFFS